MVFKASHKLDQKLKTRVSILLLVCLAMPAASQDNDLDRTSTPIASLTIRYCGNVLQVENSKYNEINLSSKFRNPSKDLIIFNRNNDIRILKRVRTQLKVARNHFRNNREIIAQLYTDVKTVMQTDYHYEWLPSQSLVWYKNHVKKLDKDTKVFILLPMLRDSLHNFSVTLDQMRQFSETHYTSNHTLRKLILDDLSKYLIAVLCEVETAMLSLSTWSSKDIPVAERTVIVGGPGWDPNPDHTAMLIQDWGVLTIYYRFLKDWLYISRKMVQDQMGSWPVATPIAVTDAVSPSGRPSPLPCIRHRCHSSKHKRRKSPAGSVT